MNEIKVNIVQIKRNNRSAWLWLINQDLGISILQISGSTVFIIPKTTTEGTLERGSENPEKFDLIYNDKNGQKIRIEYINRPAIKRKHIDAFKSTMFKIINKTNRLKDPIIEEVPEDPDPKNQLSNKIKKVEYCPGCNFETERIGNIGYYCKVCEKFV